MTRKILVTGGCGFIGSHLVDAHVAAGDHVHVIDDLSSGRAEYLNRKVAGVLFSDLADPSVLRYIAQTKFDVAYHLAAKTQVSYSVDEMSTTTDENVCKSVKLAEACVGNVGRLVFASSSSVYGDSNVVPTPESEPKYPLSPYGLQKSYVEDHCVLLSKLKGLQTVSARMFNVYGPRQLAAGQHGTVVASWLDALKHGKELSMQGDGSKSRDMVYVSDVVAALIKLGELPYVLRGECFNVGTGVSTSMRDLHELLVSVSGKKAVGTSYVEDRKADAKSTQADTSAAKNFLNMQQWIGLREGLEATAEWFMSSELT